MRLSGSKRLREFFDYLFGFDFFISYAQRDGLSYPSALADRLVRSGFDVFLDTKDYVAGDELSAATVRRARMSTKMILVLRPHALNSSWVEREVEAALSSDRDIVVIDVNNSWSIVHVEHPLFGKLKDRLRIFERIAESDGVPTDSVVGELTKSLRATRKQVFRQRLTSGVAALMTALAVTAIGFWWSANRNGARAIEERDRALAAQMSLSADLSRRRTEEGNATDGALIVLEALATSQKEARDPGLSDANAEASLYFALQNLRERKLLKHEQGVKNVSVASSRELILTTTEDQVVIWRTSDWHQIKALSPGPHVSDAAFSRDGKLIFVATSDGAVSAWDWEGTEPPRTCKPVDGSIGVPTIRVSPTQLLIMILGAPVSVFSIDNCALLFRLPSAYDAAFSEDGHFIVTGGDDGEVRSFNASNGSPIAEMTHPKDLDRSNSHVVVDHIRISRSGELIASGDDVGTIRIWRLTDGTPLKTFKHRSSRIYAAEFDVGSPGTELEFAL